MTECANISIERYTDMVVEIEKLKHKLEKEQIESERRLAHLAECEGKYNELAQNIFNHLIGNNDALYSWDKEMLLRSGITNDEIKRMTKVHNEDKTSGKSSSEEDE
jgi:predicted nuclease with TOPRIM domain